MNTYTLGAAVRCSGTFTDAAGTAIDPTAVFFKKKDSEGVITTLTYGVDSALVKDSTGNYHVDVDANKEGTWYYRFYSTGTGQAADEEGFTVEESQF